MKEVFIVGKGVNVSRDSSFVVASLRHFDDGAGFNGLLAPALGSALAAIPGALQTMIASRVEAPVAILAWRSKTETLLLCQDAARLRALEQAVVDRDDVAVIDQTGGIAVWVLRGARASDLIVRIGSVASIPAVGRALTGRLAEVTVMTLCVEPGEIIMLADRVYEEHLIGWIRESVADL